jgi:hypothetical protein
MSNSNGEKKTDCHHLDVTAFEFPFPFHLVLIWLRCSPARAVIVISADRRGSTTEAGRNLLMAVLNI